MLTGHRSTRYGAGQTNCPQDSISGLSRTQVYQMD